MNSDSAQYTLRYNEVTQALEVCIGQTWTPVLLTNAVVIPAQSITADMINSGDSTATEVLTSDGDGSASWEVPA